jgi:hypothetical protein
MTEVSGVRSSCDIVARKFDFTRSAARRRSTATSSDLFLAVSSATDDAIAASWTMPARRRAWAWCRSSSTMLAMWRATAAGAAPPSTSTWPTVSPR